MKIRFFSSIDYILLLCVLFLASVGIVFIYSSGINSEGLSVSNEYVKQIIWTAVGLVAMLAVMLLDYRILEKYSPQFFAFMALVLVYTRIFGRYVNGARSWIGIGDLGIQPSELTKIAYILFLARYLDNSSSDERSRKRFICSILIMMVPMGLILLQPDLGTASVFFPIFLFMCFMANVPIRYLMIVFLTGMLSVVFAVLPIWESEIAKRSVPMIMVLSSQKLRLLVLASLCAICVIGILGQIFFAKRYYYWITYVSGILAVALVFSWAVGKVLKNYQIMRLIVFIDPESDPLGAGWNIIQSKTAIGAGGFFGRGFLRGTQSHFRFLPQQSTDFIFSIFSEEAGFVGGIALFVVFFLLLCRITYIMGKTNNRFACYICAGILGMFFFHFIVNIGMVMGIMPITGIPLPFLSYGGSALLTNMIAIGLLMSIRSRKLDFTTAV